MVDMARRPADEAARAREIARGEGHVDGEASGRQVDEAAPGVLPVPEVGSSGYVPRGETVRQGHGEEETGSPGADADRAAAKRRGSV